MTESHVNVLPANVTCFENDPRLRCEGFLNDECIL